MSEKPHNAEHRELSIEEYHRHPAIGKSMLSDFDSHPKLFDCRHVTKDGQPFKGTPSTEFGTRVDAWLLERDLCLTIPEDVLGKGGKKTTKAWKAWEAENAGFVHFTEKDIAICQRIEANVREHKDAANLLFSDHDTQYSIFWTDPETGLECKCRPDIVPAAVLVDLKTAKSTTARDFAKQCENLKYHWQNSHYGTGWRMFTGETRPFVFLVIHNVEPFDVATFTLSDEWIERGAREIRETLRDIADRKESGIWLPPSYGRTIELSPPKYTEYDDDYAVDTATENG